MTNFILKILASFPVILISLYFVPILGICLLILRSVVYNYMKKTTTALILIFIGIIILIPKILNSINIKIPYLKDIIDFELNNKDFIEYSKFVIIIGVIFLIISVILNNLLSKISTGISQYITNQQNMDYEISKQNDMEIKIKQEKAKNTSYVRCPNCGSDNLLSEKFGTCKYCRRKIQNKNM